jgi:hypothetical protein
MFTSLLESGHTCGDHCWHAKELVCRCSCGGANHGILLTKDGIQPQRTRKIDGKFYELVSIVAYDPSHAHSVNYRKASDELKRICDERFPGLSWLGYGEWRTESKMPVLDLAISENQAKWSEVQAISGAHRLIWARPAGTPYLVDGKNHKCVYAHTINKEAETST